MFQPAFAIPIETYSIRQKAEFLLNNAVDMDDYRSAAEVVRRMGIDPDSVPHEMPKE